MLDIHGSVASTVVDLAREGSGEGFLNQTLRMADAPIYCCAPVGAARLSDEQAQATAQLFKALADPHRVRIVNLLANAGEPVCVCDITESIWLSQPTVSFHLKKLVSSGLLHREKRATWAYYSLNKESLRQLADVVKVKGLR